MCHAQELNGNPVVVVSCRCRHGEMAFIRVARGRKSSRIMWCYYQRLRLRLFVAELFG